MRRREWDLSIGATAAFGSSDSVVRLARDIVRRLSGLVDGVYGWNREAPIVHNPAITFTLYGRAYLESAVRFYLMNNADVCAYRLADKLARMYHVHFE